MKAERTGDTYRLTSDGSELENAVVLSISEAMFRLAEQGVIGDAVANDHGCVRPNDDHETVCNFVTVPGDAFVLESLPAT